MAGPQKKGLEYFPLDVNFYGDIKVRKLMRNNGGGKAAFVYITLLCKIYESGYYMVWDDDMSFMLSDITGFEEGMVRETVKSCMKFGLLDQELFNQHHILTSKSIQARYFSAIKRRVKGKALPYVYPELLEELTNMTAENHDNNELMSTETEFLHTETPLMSTESTQKESKVNNKSPLRSDLLSSSSTTTTTSRVREDDDKKFMDAETVKAADVIEDLKRNRDWLLQMQRRFGLPSEKIIAWLTSFNVECNCRGTQVHIDQSDVMRHFNDWLKKQIKPAKGTKNHQGQPVNYATFWNRAHAELCLSVSPDLSRKSFDLVRFCGYQESPPVLSLQIPAGIYDILETEPCISKMSEILTRYFDLNVKIQYHLMSSNNGKGSSDNPGQGTHDRPGSTS
jgi:hypothetical protein